VGGKKGNCAGEKKGNYAEKKGNYVIFPMVNLTFFTRF